ncbi:hypothetical protein [Paenibacillus chungangensis]|uniref:Lipoprotein n=1 Tax=Paenibacillus chungangensis TaxID=696535 RepID=A0ABW3HJW4_9BACL
MKQVKRLALMAVLLTAVIVAGCSSSQPPKESLQTAMKNTMAAESYKMNMTLQIDDLQLGDLAAEQTGGIDVAGIIKGAKLSADTMYTKEPMRMDMNMEINLPGMMDMKLAVPMIVTKDEMYVKIPNLPMLPLPEQLFDQYIKMDLQELAEQSGQQISMDVATQQKMAQEFAAVFMDNFDEKTYFTEVKAADAGLPEGMKADQVVKFAITKDNYDGTVDTMVNKVVPAIFDLLLNNEDYLNAVGLEKAQVESAKESWDNDKDQALDSFKELLTVNTLDITTAIQDKYMVHQDVKIDLDLKNPEGTGETMKFIISFAAQYSDFNKKQEHPELPADAITMEELMEQFQAPMGM